MKFINHFQDLVTVSPSHGYHQRFLLVNVITLEWKKHSINPLHLHHTIVFDCSLEKKIKQIICYKHLKSPFNWWEHLSLFLTSAALFPSRTENRPPDSLIGFFIFFFILLRSTLAHQHVILHSTFTLNNDGICNYFLLSFLPCHDHSNRDAPIVPYLWRYWKCFLYFSALFHFFMWLGLIESDLIIIIFFFPQLPMKREPNKASLTSSTFW